MATIYPFAALRPSPRFAAEVASVPYDVVNTDEAKQLAADKPRSFLHVTKPEIDLPEGVDSHSEEVYRHGQQALQRFIDESTLIRDSAEHLYLYRLTWRGRQQTGVVMLASVDEYNRNEVRKHEYTRPDKEDDRAHHMQVLGAQSGTVFLLHRDAPSIDAVVEAVTKTDPEVDFEAADGVRHQVWTVPAESTQALVTAFAGNGPLYIADGHHRSAAAARVAAQRQLPEAGFLAVSFPISEVQILPYNRVVRDLNGMTIAQFEQVVAQRFDVLPGKPDPIEPRHFGMFLNGQWTTLVAKTSSFDPNDPVDSLDVSILQNQLLGPVLGIEDPRRDQRIDFVGGIRGDAELEKRVSAGWAVAFKMPATAVEQLLAIADAEQVMPPKSTWFEPKLRDGLFVHLL